MAETLRRIAEGIGWVVILLAALGALGFGDFRVSFCG